MNRRNAVAALAALGSAAAFPLARAQAPARIPRVAIFMYGSPANFRSRGEAFPQGMARLGYVEGRDVKYEWHTANGQDDLVRTLARQLSDEQPDVILSASTPTSRALRQATKTIPVVMAAVEDPVAEGFVQSLARPGFNMTGISASVLGQLARHLQLLAEAAPRLAHVTALLNPGDSTYGQYRNRVQSAAKPLRMRLDIVDARTPGQIARAFESHERDDARGMIVMNDPLFYNERRYITELAALARRPAIYTQRGFVSVGGLMSYGPDPEANFADAATYVDRILKGAKPAELPIAPSRRFELTVNRDAARDLGLTLSPGLLKRASRIVG